MQTVAPSRKYQTNVDTLLSSLSSNTTNESRFYNTTVGIGANQVYGVFFCRIDQTVAICQECISLAINSLNSRCRGQKESVVWYDQCLVRYSNDSFFGTMNDAPMIPMWNRQNAVDIQNITNNQMAFTQVLLETLRNVSSQAATGPSGKKFATKEGKFVANLTSMNLLYTLAECTPDISVRDCNTCLQMTIGNMTEMCNMKAGCTMMNPSCNMRYDVYAFYGDALTPALGPPHVPLLGAILAMVILVGAWTLTRKRKSKKPIEADDSEDSHGYVYALCPSMETVSPTSNYQINLNTTLSFLSSNSTGKTRFYNTTVGSGDSKIYGLFFCRLDVTDSVCQNCVSLAIRALTTRCPGKKESIVWYFDQCVTRYSDTPFLGTMHDTPMIPMWNRENSLDVWNVTSNMTGFMHVLMNTMNSAADNATGGSSDSKFATEEATFPDNLTSLNTIYTLAECTADISLVECRSCLRSTIGNITELCNVKAGCTLMCPNCNIRYDTYPFYGDAVADSSRRSPVPVFPGTNSKFIRRKQTILIGAITGAALAVTLVFAVMIFLCKRKSKETYKADDKAIENAFLCEEAAKCIHIGLLCIQEDAARRPRMASVVAALSGDAIVLPTPTPPHFFMPGAFGLEESGVDQSGLMFSGTRDITVVDPR
ncbi:hypothetical protein SOVF_090770 isoform B, partial [Spinacia oleracea]